MSFRKWQPSKTAKHEFAQTMQKIDDFCSKNDIIYIHAGKTRIIEIYNNLKNGYQLDGRGNIKNNLKSIDNF